MRRGPMDPEMLGERFSEALKAAIGGTTYGNLMGIRESLVAMSAREPERVYVVTLDPEAMKAAQESVRMMRQYVDAFGGDSGALDRAELALDPNLAEVVDP